MNLFDVVHAIVTRNPISAKDIEDTILLLVEDGVLHDIKIFRRIVKKLNDKLEYENAPVA